MKTFVDDDRTRARAAVAQSLYRRRLTTHCEENRIEEQNLTQDIKTEILAKSKSMYEEFLSAVARRKVALNEALFELSIPGTSAKPNEAIDES